MNGQQFSSRGVTFTYGPSASVSSVWPARGVSEGGTPLTVLGRGFSSSAEASGALVCRFNATTVAGAYVSSWALVCNTTASGAGVAAVEVSTNGREYTSSGVPFEFVSSAVTSLRPWSGPSAGGTVVTLDGSRVVFGGSVACSFVLVDGSAPMGVLSLIHISEPTRPY